MDHANPIQTVTQCPSDIVPSGWVVERFNDVGGACGGVGYEIVIADLNNQLSGAEYTCCNLVSPPIPNGWAAVGHSTDFSRCGSANVRPDNLVTTEAFSKLLSVGPSIGPCTF